MENSLVYQVYGGIREQGSKGGRIRGREGERGDHEPMPTTSLCTYSIDKMEEVEVEEAAVAVLAYVHLQFVVVTGRQDLRARVIQSEHGLQTERPMELLGNFGDPFGPAPAILFLFHHHQL